MKETEKNEIKLEKSLIGEYYRINLILLKIHNGVNKKKYDENTSSVGEVKPYSRGCCEIVYNFRNAKVFVSCFFRFTIKNYLCMRINL